MVAEGKETHGKSVIFTDCPPVFTNSRGSYGIRTTEGDLGIKTIQHVANYKGSEYVRTWLCVSGRFWGMSHNQ